MPQHIVNIGELGRNPSFWWDQLVVHRRLCLGAQTARAESHTTQIKITDYKKIQEQRLQNKVS